MDDAFHSLEINPYGATVKVGTHRSALGVNDFDTSEEYQAAVTAMLEKHCGKGLASVLANISADKVEKEKALKEQSDRLGADRVAEVKALNTAHAAHCAKLEADIAALEAAHAAEKAALEADIAILGTKPEAAEMRKAKDIATARAEADAAMNKLAKLLGAEMEPAQLLPVAQPGEELTEDEPFIIEGADDAK